MSSVRIGRLLIGPPTQWHENVGDPITNLGGAPVPQPRSALRHAVSLDTFAADGATDTVAARLTIRRQLRSLLNNTPLKLQGYTYLQYSDDPEQNGWYVPDQGSFADGDGASGLATGWWKLESVVWMLAGHPRVNREARNVWMKDLRGGTFWRDALKFIYSTDFSALPTLQLTVLPNGASSAINTVTAQVVLGTVLPTGRDGGVCQICAGLNDLATVSYERPESAFNGSDVIVYDRRGQITAPATGPDTLWEEVYGPDYPWNWLTAGQPQDAPVIDNGLVRVRWDNTNTPGFRVDIWNGAAYVEQGKLTITRVGDVTGVCDTWVSAGLHTDNGYTPDRATIAVVLANSADTSSRERIYITVQRGELGATFECYPAPKAAGTNADAILQWTPALNAGVADLNNSVAKIDGQGSGSWTPSPPAAAQNSGPTPGILAATAGTGAGTGKSGLFGAVATLGAANFTSSENWVAVLRYPTAFNVIAPYQHTLVVLQAATAKVSYLGNTSTAYGTNADSYQVSSQTSAGYIQCQVAFSATQADQVMECESMTLGANTTAGGDPSASGAATTQSSRATDANAHVTRVTWPNSFLATYRVWARVKTTAAQMSVYAKTGATTGTTVTVTGAATPSYTWVDLGEIVANNSTFELHAWVSSGAGIVECDRIEAALVQDRARTTAIYSGARDAGQAALQDSRWLGAVVAR